MLYRRLWWPVLPPEIQMPANSEDLAPQSEAGKDRVVCAVDLGKASGDGQGFAPGHAIEHGGYGQPPDQALVARQSRGAVEVDLVVHLLDHLPVLVNQQTLRVGQYRGRIGFEGRDAARDQGWVPQVVIGRPHEVGTRGLAQHTVEVGRNSQIRLIAEIPNAAEPMSVV